MHNSQQDAHIERSKPHTENGARRTPNSGFYDTNLELALKPGRALVMPGSSGEDIRLDGEFELYGAGKMPVDRRVFVAEVTVGKNSIFQAICTTFALALMQRKVIS